MSADPLTLLGAFLPDAPKNMTPGQLTMQLLDVNPAVGYGPGGLYEKAPEKVSENPVVNAAHNLGRVFQAGSGAEGVLGGAGSVVAQALGDLPAASDAMGVMLPVSLANKTQLQQLPAYTTLRDKLFSQAESMPDMIEATQEVWRRTGWDQPGIDRIPRVELSDAKLRVAPKAEWQAMAGSEVMYLPDLIEHPELFKQIPQLKDVQLYPYYFDSPSNFVSGSYGQSSVGPGDIQLHVPSNATEADIASSASHEIQHAIDAIGGATPTEFAYLSSPFSQGGNVNMLREALEQSGLLDQIDPFKFYLALGHETLARNVESRFRSARGAMPTGYVKANVDARPGQVYSELLGTPGFDALAPSLTSPIPVEQQIYGYWRNSPLKGLTASQRQGIKRDLAVE